MIRTFISVPVPITEKIEEVLSDLRGIKGVRASPKGQIHITLKFLGDTDEKKVMRLCQTLKESLKDTEGFDVSVEGIGAFPNERNPRVIWLGIKEPKMLCGIADIVDTAVKELNLKCDSKPFSPHITVGRMEHRVDLEDIFRKYGKEQFCSFRCDRIDVMKSELTPKGAIHSIIESIPLR